MEISDKKDEIILKEAAEILIDQKQCGWIGQLHPRIQRKLGQDCEFYLFELVLKDLLQLLGILVRLVYSFISLV